MATPSVFNNGNVSTPPFNPFFRMPENAFGNDYNRALDFTLDTYQNTPGYNPYFNQGPLSPYNEQVYSTQPQVPQQVYVPPYQAPDPFQAIAKAIPMTAEFKQPEQPTKDSNPMMKAISELGKQTPTIQNNQEQESNIEEVLNRNPEQMSSSTQTQAPIYDDYVPPQTQEDIYKNRNVNAIGVNTLQDLGESGAKFVEDQKQKMAAGDDFMSDFDKKNTQSTASTETTAKLTDDTKIGPSEYLHNTDPLTVGYDEFFANEDAAHLAAGDQEYFDIGNASVMNEFDPTQTDWINTMQSQSIDDGKSNSRQSRISQWMTGEQYIKYAQLTNSGRPIEEIDPNQMYNKLDEERIYGFEPYRPDENASKWLDFQRRGHDVSTSAQRFGNLRDTLFDYTIAYNGQEFSGDEFDQKKNSYLRQTNDQAADLANAELWSDKEKAGPNAVPYRVAGTAVQVGDEVINVNSTADPVASMNPDGSGIVTFPDTGETIQIPDINNCGFAPIFEMVNNDEEADFWRSDLQPLVLDDGTTLTYNQVIDVSMNGAGDRDYGWGALGAPAGTEDTPWWDNFIDMGLNSVPFMVNTLPALGPIGWGLDAALGGGMAMDALTSGGQVTWGGMNNGNSWNKAHEEVTPEQYVTSAAASAVLPFTERAAGIGGAKVLGGLANKIGKHLPETAARPFAEMGADVFEEGLEEIFPGNPVEELIDNGVVDMFGNQEVDEEGNPVYDAAGAPEIDSNTPIEDRIANFVQAAPEAFGAGASLAGVLEAATIPRRWRQSKTIRDTNRRLKEQGLGPMYRPGKPSTQAPDDLEAALDAYFSKGA